MAPRNLTRFLGEYAPNYLESLVSTHDHERVKAMLRMALYSGCGAELMAATQRAREERLSKAYADLRVGRTIYALTQLALLVSIVVEWGQWSWALTTGWFFALLTAQGIRSTYALRVKALLKDPDVVL